MKGIVPIFEGCFLLYYNKLFSSRRCRYKVVSFVSIIEKLQQAIDYKMLYSMDPATDNYASFYMEKATYYIVATVFMVHMD